MADKNFVLKRGLRNIYAAEVVIDDSTDKDAYEAGPTFHLIPAGEMTRNTGSESTHKYFDNTVFATIGKEGATEVAITGAALRPEMLAKITNKYVDSSTGAVIDTGEYEPKYFALGGEAENDDGTLELFWFLKGTFSIPEQADKTKDDTTDANGMTLTYSAVPTKHLFDLNGKKKPVKRVVIDTSVTELIENKKWEAQVITPLDLSTYVKRKITT